MARPIQSALYLPVEESDREFVSKLYLAMLAAEQGYLVIIGHAPFFFLNLETLAPGLLLTKGMNSVQKTGIEAAVRAGHVAMSMDEEALGSASEYWMSRDIDRDIHQFVDLVFAQGEFHANVLRQHRDFRPDRIAIVGNPRLDFLNTRLSKVFEEEADAIKDEYGSFVLLNTNCGAVNSSKYASLEEYQKVLVQTGWMNLGDATDMRNWEQHIVQDRLHQSVMGELVDRLPSALPNHRVILRPHPGEDIEYWVRRSEGNEQIIVARNGNVIPWMMASDMVVQTGCTTGVEANLLGRPCLSITPTGGPIGDVFLSNLINPTCNDATTACQLIRRALLHDDQELIERSKALRLVRGQHLDLSPSKSSAARLLDELRRTVSHQILPPTVQGLRFRNKGLKVLRDTSGFRNSKFHTKIAHVRDWMRKFSTIDPRFQDVMAREIHDDVFVIQHPSLDAKMKGV